MTTMTVKINQGLKKQRAARAVKHDKMAYGTAKHKAEVKKAVAQANSRKKK